MNLFLVCFNVFQFEKLLTFLSYSNLAVIMWITITICIQSTLKKKRQNTGHSAKPICFNVTMLNHAICRVMKAYFCTHLFAPSIYDLGWGRSSIPQQAHPAGGGGAGPSSGEVGNSPAEAGRGWEGCWWEREVTASIQSCCCSVLCTQLTQCNNTRERGIR